MCWVFGSHIGSLRDSVSWKNVDSSLNLIVIMNQFNFCYFVGTSSNTCFNRFQKGSTVLIRQRSVEVCGLRMVGPNDTTSR